MAKGSEPKAWTIILEEVEATDKDVVSLGKRLVQSAADAGHTVRITTVASWLFSARTAPPERFVEAPKIGPGENASVRRNGRSLGNGPRF